jgi:uncharacterized protein (DUF362 family)/Pyruvate/2-oxoacid:ferredoxin oxidoreductase delta subunit
MAKARVSIARCPDYSEKSVLEAVECSLGLLGGMDAFIKRGDRVLIKPNLLVARKPEEAVTTHPSVVKAVIQLVRDAGGVPMVGDSPAIGGLLRVASKAGIYDMVRRMNCELVDFNDTTQVKGSHQGVFRTLDVAGAVLDCDLLINLPKLKTHGMTTMTLSVKNLFGCIPGVKKVQWHFKAGVNRRYFAQMLVDLYGIIRPGLNVVDAVVGMEGDGPNGGDPREIGLIFAGADGIAVDSTICDVIGLPPLDLLTNRIGSDLGLGVGQLKDIEVVGEAIEEVKVKGFRFPRSMEPQWGLPWPLRGLLRNVLTAKPRVREDVCKLCEVCVEGCPAQAITGEGGRIDIDYSRCIRCFCCSEFCPERAIDVQRGWLLRLFGGHDQNTKQSARHEKY